MVQVPVFFEPKPTLVPGGFCTNLAQLRTVYTSQKTLLLHCTSMYTVCEFVVNERTFPLIRQIAFKRRMKAKKEREKRQRMVRTKFVVTLKS